MDAHAYFSYKIGTKTFSGKNVFTPGQSAMLGFDFDFSESKRGAGLKKIIVIAGAPCSGKTTLITHLRAMGYTCYGETAEILIQEGVTNGRTVEDIRIDPVAWQTSLLDKDLALFRGLLEREGRYEEKDGMAFTDTSFVETVVFSRRTGIHIGPNVSRWLREQWQEKMLVFFLSSLPQSQYEQTSVRMESSSEAQSISEEVRSAYREFGLHVEDVPPVSVDRRAAMILERLRHTWAQHMHRNCETNVHHGDTIPS